MLNFTETTPIAALTVGDLKELMRDFMSTNGNAADSRFSHKPSGHYVYGLRGIQQLFGVSHKTAQEYKDGLIKDAVRQNGRKIVVDADLALELFNQKKSR